MARNAAAIGVAAAALVAIISVAVAIWHPETPVRVGAALFACLSFLVLLYRTYRYRALALNQETTLELSA